MKRMLWVTLRFALLGSLFAGMAAGLSGCRSRDSTAPQESGIKGPEAKQPSAVALDPATLGKVSGTVSFAGKPPAPVKIDTSMDPACGLGGSGDLYSEQYVVRDGKLANVYVYVKSGPPAALAAAPPESASPTVMDQKGCRYVPHVIALPAGATVEFRNSDVTMHNIHTMPTAAGNQTIDVSQGPRGTPELKKFQRPDVMIPVRCNNHPWMNAFINVSATPFFAVTDEGGRFHLDGMPAGQYTLGAVHEKLGEQEIRVTVTPLSTATAAFKFATK